MPHLRLVYRDKTPFNVKLSRVLQKRMLAYVISVPKNVLISNRYTPLGVIKTRIRVAIYVQYLYNE